MKSKKLIYLLSILLMLSFIVNANAKTEKLNVNIKNTSLKKETTIKLPNSTENKIQAGDITFTGKILYVSKSTGSNKNDGSKASPFKNIDKAIKEAVAGDKIYIAEGEYSGTFNIGYLESDKPLMLYGSWDVNFTKQDIVNHPTLFQPDNASAAKSRKALLSINKESGGTIIDGIVWDMGERNSYSSKEGLVEGVNSGMILLPPTKETGQNATVTEPIISIRAGTKGGDVTIQNCVFVNGASFAIQAAETTGTFKVINNVFVANRMASIEIFGTCAGSKEKKDMVACGNVEIAFNTILFTWSRLKDFLDMGYGVRIMTKLEYNIHHNIIGASIMGGVDNSRFCKDEYVKIDNNIMFGNKGGDLYYTPASNTTLKVYTNEFEDLEFASVTGNQGVAPNIPVNQDYLKGFFNARYNEVTSYDPNSAQNQWSRALGMNQQGTMKSKVSMFMNKYPWKEALKLFGGTKNTGAQKP
ncbi:MAG: DUF1565 domain-containing protein [Bacteroidales bacterium]|nr:DUF1565 domain-containing protein [Bacteroidales bacterium]MBN2757268.1 DUF1565 domain-containing protein [Bacteroidales bacterium]